MQLDLVQLHFINNCKYFRSRALQAFLGIFFLMQLEMCAECNYKLYTFNDIDYVRNCVMGLHIDEYFAHVVNFWLGPLCKARP